MIVSIVLPYAIAAFTLALLLATWRLLIGPQIPDRVLALDTLYINALALLVLAGLQYRTSLYFEVALVISMLGFIGTVVLAKFMSHGDIAE
jgi:multicomponent K+:H+ antiporter subunit F